MSAQKNPYVGPRAFDFGEMLYGRDDEARMLFDVLIAERIVLLYSPSGAGKTSLIHARLIPKLKQEEFTVLPTIRVNAEPAREADIAAANRYLLSAMISLEKGFLMQNQLSVAELAAFPSLKDYLDARYSSISSPVAFILDQFEEILTCDPTDGDAKCEFIQQVGKTLRNPRYWALFSMREDYIAGLDGYVGAIPTRLSTRFRLDLLNSKQAAEAIRKPAADEGITFSAADKLASELSQVRVQRADGSTELKSGAWVEPVQLQVVCRRIWEKPRKNPTEISETDLSGLQDVDTALGEYYDERVKAIVTETKVPERAIREWFSTYLITERGIRGQVLRGPDESQGLPNTAVDALLRDYLIRAEERRGATWYELAHDRLVDPIRTSNVLWAQKNLAPLESRAAEWEAKGKRSQYLLRDEELVAAARWAAEHADQLTPREQAFLSASRGMLSDFERTAIHWELGGRSSHDLLKSGALRAAEQFADKEGESSLSGSERALLSLSKNAREVENENRTRSRILKTIIAALTLALIVGGAISYVRKSEDNTKMRQKLEQIEQQQAQLEAERKKTNDLASAATPILNQFAIEQFAIPSQGVLSAEVLERLKAQGRIESLLPAGDFAADSPDEPSRTRIEYFAKPSDNEKLGLALKDLGIPVNTRPARTTNITNCLWYGSQVLLKDVQLVAYALIRAGASLQGIQPMVNDDEPLVIQIGRNPRLADQAPFNLDALDKTPIPALRRTEAKVLSRGSGFVTEFVRGKQEGTVMTAGGVPVTFLAAQPSATFNVGDPVEFTVYRSATSTYAENVKKVGAPGTEPEQAPFEQRQLAPRTQ